MFIFAVSLLVYDAILAITKENKMLPFWARVSVKPKNAKKYAVQLAKVIALTALAIAAGVAVSLWCMAAGAIMMIAGVITALWSGTKIVKNE